MNLLTPEMLPLIAAAAAAILCFVSLFVFISTRTVRAGEEKEALARQLADSLSVGAFILKNNKFIYVNDSLCQLMGYTPALFKKMKWQDIASIQSSEETAEMLKMFREKKSEKFSGELVGIKGDGSKTFLKVNAHKMRDSPQGDVVLISGTATPVVNMGSDPDNEDGGRKPGIDTLTQLPGVIELRRKVLHEVLEGGAFSFALVLIDVDSLNRVNDTIGRDAGDQLLIEASKRLSGCEGDRVYRFKGDEFALLLEDVTREDAIQHMERITKEFAAPLKLFNTPWYESVTMGASFYPDDADNGSQVIEFAKAAVHFAKQVSKGSYQIYNPGISRRLKNQLELEMDLRHALSRGELAMYYQPQVDLSSGTLVGTEALMRWVHPQRGVISPGVFIPLAEEIGVIEEIGEWALKTACRQTRLWNEKGLLFHVSVNLSPKQIFQDNLVDMVRSVLKQTGLAAKFLQLEITETADADLVMMSKKLSEIRDLGIGISIDDFGTGYNSMNYLKSLPLTQLKIDQSFIRKDYYNSHNMALIRTFVDLADELDLEVVAEGVETGEHVRFLKTVKCDLAQGYLFGRPLSAANLLGQLPIISKQINQNVIRSS